MVNGCLIFEKRGRIATITLDRPKTLNALNRQLLTDLAEAGREITDDPEIRAAIVTGAGRGFSSGGDLKESSPGGYSGTSVVQNPPDQWIARLLAVNKPTIAAVNGIAAGGGLGLALACDIRIASDKARFSAIFSNIGATVRDGVGSLLPKAVGVAKALELLYTAEIIDAQEAERIGLVSYVVEHERLVERATELAERIAAGPPIAIQLTRNVVYSSLHKSYLEHVPDQYHAMIASSVLAPHDIAEGARAFAEKRRPSFRGIEPESE